MYPTLYHAFLDLFGLRLEPLKLINTFGFMVALAFLTAATTLAWELERRQQLGQFHAVTRPAVAPGGGSLLDVAFSGFIAFFLGLKLGGLVLGGVELKGGTDGQKYLFSWQGHLVSGIALGLAWTVYRFLAYRKAEQAKASQDPKNLEGQTMVVSARDHVGGITGAAAIGGFLGAKLFHWLEAPERIREVFEHPSMEALFGGLTIYGGLIVGAFCCWRYARRNGLSFPHLCDATAPGLMLAYSIGRLGCQLAGDGDWGIANNKEVPSGWPLPHWLWSYDYPNNVIGSGQRLAEGAFPGYGTHLVPSVYPTPLYESMAAALLFVVLWSLRKRLTRPLALFGVYLLVNGFERFWIEKIRVNAHYNLFGLQATQAELIAVALMIGGVVLLVTRRASSAPASATAADPAPREASS
jgi:phosphatidylglycerol---prolipoprotein diacylglyceryl transferase